MIRGAGGTGMLNSRSLRRGRRPVKLAPDLDDDDMAVQGVKAQIQRHGQPLRPRYAETQEPPA
jgi:hypothetical protein